MFHMVVCWQKLDEVKNECNLHNFIVLSIFVPKVIKFSENLTKLWQKTILTVFFLRHDVYCSSFVSGYCILQIARYNGVSCVLASMAFLIWSLIEHKRAQCLVVWKLCYVNESLFMSYVFTSVYCVS